MTRQATPRRPAAFAAVVATLGAVAAAAAFTLTTARVQQHAETALIHAVTAPRALLAAPTLSVRLETAVITGKRIAAS